MGARIRFFCLALPGPSLGFEYLQALEKTGLGVLACAIGQGYLGSPPWDGVVKAFQGATDKKYVNVVCAPAGFLLGTRMARHPDGTLTPDGKADAVYEPATALSGLYTAGVRNVAITMCKPEFSASEAKALAKYDAVRCPTAGDAAVLRSLGAKAEFVPPAGVGMLKELLESLLHDDLG